MTVNLSYPGVYIREIASEVRTITGVATSVTAFIGRTRRGPTDRPGLVHSFTEFTRIYGALWTKSPVSYAVSQYFLNGGRDAVICRVAKNARTASVVLATTAPGVLTLQAASAGAWGAKLRVRVKHDPTNPDHPSDPRFNLFVKDLGTGQVETFLNLSSDPAHPRFLQKVLDAESELVRTQGAVPASMPKKHGDTPNKTGADLLEDDGTSTAFSLTLTPDPDGDDITASEIVPSAPDPANPRGLGLLDLADTVNLICVPPPDRDTDWTTADVWDHVIGYAEKRRAVVIVDPHHDWATHTAARNGLDSAVAKTANAAIYYPRILAPDPLQENRVDVFAPCGVVAGVLARTDATRGVWKAPAGLDATLLGVSGLEQTLTDDQNGELNPLGINCLRQFPVAGRVVWGARTLKGADQLANEWKYLPVRRTALYIEESLFRGTKWVVFEPNDEPLWSQIRLNVGAFMHDLFRQGAFQGRTPKEAYFAKCDNESTSQTDINNGVVNIVVGFAPLKPAEFVVISLQQMAGQIAT